MMLIWLVLFLIIGYLVYQDANKRGMNGLLWGILVIIPMVGLLFLVIYIVIRETGTQKPVIEGKDRDGYSQGTLCEGRDYQRAVPENE